MRLLVLGLMFDFFSFLFNASVSLDAYMAWKNIDWRSNKRGRLKRLSGLNIPSCTITHDFLKDTEIHWEGGLAYLGVDLKKGMPTNRSIFRVLERCLSTAWE